MIDFNELSDAVPEREKIKQLLLSNSCYLLGQVIQDALVNDAALVELQKLLVKAYDAGYNSGFDEGETALQNTTAYELEQEYQKGWNDGYDEARDEYR